MSNSVDNKPTFQDTLLLEEYKLIQGKIDKLGEDKFKVRNWCFTVVTGALAVAKLSGSLDSGEAAYILLFFFIPAIAAFQLVELRQRKVAGRYGERAHCIEMILRKLHSTGESRDTAAPGLAWHLIQHGNKERKRCTFKNWLSSKFRVEQQATVETDLKQKRLRNEKPPSFLDCLIFRADRIFYYVLYGIIGAFLVVLILKHFSGSNPKSDNAGSLVIRINTGEFDLFVRQTNVVVTNFVPVTQFTTNFETIVRHSTNFIVTDIYVTNITTK
jgi:hypothetical protein